MLRLAQSRRQGFSIIELMIGLAVLGIVLMVGLPSLATWIQNTQVKTSAESMSAGLQLARAEALRRNSTVRFQLVNSLNAGCALSTSGTNWVVSQTDASGNCNIAPSETTAPQIIQKWAGTEGAPNAVITSSAVGTVYSGNISFNGLGRMIGGGTVTINVASTAGACQTAAGPIRCLTLTVGPDGSARMCDPAVTDAADPRFC